MPIKFLAMMPHGDSIDPFKWSFKNIKTKKSLFLLKRLFCSKNIDTTLIISPHAIYEKNCGITINCSKELKAQTAKVDFTFNGDSTFIDLVRKEEFRNISVYAINNSSANIDWGTYLPALYTVIYQKNKKMAVLSIDPKMPSEEIKNFGFKLAENLEKDNRNIAIIISCDQSHTHSKDGPYGFSEFASLIDFKIKDLIIKNKISKISFLGKTKAFKESCVDSLIPMLFLSGILRFNKFKSVFLSYERGEILHMQKLKDYYGMITSYFSDTVIY